MRKLVVELYRVQFPPAKTLELIQQKGIATGEREGAVLVDQTKPVAGELSPFGRVLLLG